MKWRFALKFLLTFTILIPLWWRFGIGEGFRDAVLATVQLLSPAVNGWWLERAAATATFRRGGDSLPFLLNLPSIAMGLMPLTSLIVATPGQGLQRIALRVPAAVALYFAVDVAVVLAYPYFMHDPGSVKDTVGVFAGMVAFVVAPLGIWFIVTYPTLQSLWQIGGSAPPALKAGPVPRATQRARRS